MWSMKSAAVLAISLWVFILLYLSTQLFGIQGKSFEAEERLSEKMLGALETLNELRKQNMELKELIQKERAENAERSQNEKAYRELLLSQLKTDDKHSLNEKNKEQPESKQGIPTFDHEIARRQLDRGVWEIFYYLHNYFKNNPSLATAIGNHTENQLLSLLSLSANMSFVDGADSWRQDDLKKLSNKIQTAIDKLQNPSDCSTTKALICGLDKECGFGCQLHHVAFCFLTAFGTGRTLVLKDNGERWRYSHKGWEAAFLPVTKCDYKTVVGKEHIVNFDIKSTARVVGLPIIDGMLNKPIFLPLSFPKQIEKELQKLHSNPPVFFVGQFIWYLMRSNKDLDDVINKAKTQISFRDGPIVGVQVRRTDKIGTEAAFHSIEEYMEWVEIWFKIQDRLAGKKIKRRVYIASDDPQVVPEAKEKYPDYSVYGDISIANTAQMNQRYTDASLFGVVTDIRLLSECDYLVCTFSSQVCRMGFELMQVRLGDAGEKFHSLDDLYYYGGQFAHEQIAIESYTPEKEGEIELEIGDTIGIAGNHWNGFSKGQNRRTGKNGLYPSYKAMEKWRIVDFPEF